MVDIQSTAVVLWHSGFCGKHMRILVAEDHPPSMEILQMFLEGQGHEVVGATDGPSVLARMEQHHPDLCILDVTMPGMDGYQVASGIRQRSGPRWVPIIFLSARTATDDMVLGLESGGDDYLTKPVNFRLLGAKIRAMARINALQSELAQHYDRVMDEHLLAQGILEGLCNSPGRQDQALKWVVMPLQAFSGDQVSAYRSPEGVFTVLLADAMGHGLAAAICLLPILKTFAGMAPKGEPLSRLAREMNQELRALIPGHRFVALLLIRFDPVQREIQVWNGGIPTCLVLGEGGRMVRSFESQHPPMGILPDALFQAEPEVFPCPDGTSYQVVACSDGMTEALNEAGEPFDMDRILETWREGPTDTGFERVLMGVYAHLAGRPLLDDFSMLTVRCT